HIALGNENQIPREPSVFHGASAVHRRYEAVIRPQGSQGGGAGIELGCGSREKKMIGIVGVECFTISGVDNEDSPVGLPIVRAVDYRFDFSPEITSRPGVDSEKEGNEGDESVRQSWHGMF